MKIISEKISADGKTKKYDILTHDDFIKILKRSLFLLNITKQMDIIKAVCGQLVGGKYV